MIREFTAENHWEEIAKLENPPGLDLQGFVQSAIIARLKNVSCPRITRTEYARLIRWWGTPIMKLDGKILNLSFDQFPGCTDDGRLKLS